MRWGCAAAVAWLAACGSDGAELFVDVRTDLRPGVEAAAFRTELLRAREGGARAEREHVARADADYVAGQRIATFEDIADGAQWLRVTVLASGARTLVERLVRVSVRGRTVVTVVITRDCEGVVCPADDPALEACLAGMCVDPQCTVETPELCPSPECSSGSECTTGPACTRASCAGGVCLYAPDEMLCGDAGPGDAGPLDAGPQDAGPPDAGPSCEWSAPVRVAGINDASNDDWDPFLSADGQRLYFGSWRAGDSDIYVATRTGRGAPFDVPALVTVNTDSFESDAHESDDARTLVFVSNRGAGMDLDFWTSTRAAPGGPFGLEMQVPVSTDDNEEGPHLSPDALRLYFSRRVGSNWDLHVAERDATGLPFRTPLPLALVNTANVERGASLSLDETELWFASDRDGDFDLYVARRTVRTEAFRTVEAAPAILQTARDELAPSISRDGLELYYNRDTCAAGGCNSDVWVSTRPCVP